MSPTLQNQSFEKIRYITFLYIIRRSAPFPAFHNIFSYKVNVPYVENLKTPNISYPRISDTSAHTTQEIGKAAMFPVFLD